MNRLLRTLRVPSRTGWALLCLGVLTGCDRGDVQVYRVAKEKAAPEASASGMPHNHPEVSRGARIPPQLKWTLPAGWEEVAPGEMRVASFKVQDGGKQAEMGVVPLPGMMGKDVESVNRWRATVGLPPVSEEELPKLSEKIEVAGEPADMYDQGGENPGSGDKTRIIAAIMRKDGVAWFFKFTGDDELVAKQKPAFVGLLKSLRFEGSSAAASGAETATLPPSHPPIEGSAGSGQTSAKKPVWQIPENWKDAPAGPFLVAKFNITGAENNQAAVNVSMSTGTGGGIEGNINRWRGQLGLGQLGEEEIKKLATSLDTAAGKATMVDMTGTDARTGQKARLIGAIVPREGHTWFYKLMGDENLVGLQREAFSAFVRTARYD